MMNPYNRTSLHHQHGLSTILIVLLMGVSITAAILGGLHFIQGSQVQTSAFHSQTQAQIRTWTGVEALSRHFQSISEGATVDEIEALRTTLDADDAAGTMLFDGQDRRAVIAGVMPGGDVYRVTVHVSGGSGAADSRARSASTIEAVYDFAIQAGEPAVGAGGEMPPSVISFNRNLNLGGSITVNPPPDASYEINVNGIVTTGGNSINGVDTINATDSIQIGSGSTYKVLRSNGDIAITGSVSIETSMMAMGNICVTGGTTFPGLAQANGFVYGSGSAGFGSILARGQSTYFGAAPQCDNYYLLDSHGETFGVNLAGDNIAGDVETSASVRHHSGLIQALTAEGDLHITNGGGRVTSGTIGGQKKYCTSGPNDCQATFPDWKTDVNVNVSPGMTVSIAELEAVVVEVSVFDAYLHEENANYAFRVDGTGYKKVTVRSVSQVDDGEYYIADYENNSETDFSRGYKDFLCTTLAADSTPAAPLCQAPVLDPPGTLCLGYSTYDNCFAYDAGTGTWSLNGTSMSQGIAWFEGNLILGDGVYYNTFIATGNIATEGSHKNYAPNYAGYSGTFEGEFYAPRGICTNAISAYAPIVLCNLDGTYNPEGAGGIGNYAYMAGSIVEGVYNGGNIVLGSSNESFGNILAGNDFTSSGESVVNGFITALAGGTGSGNAMSGSTTINLDRLPPTFTPSTPPPTGVGETGEPTLSVELLWTRYL